MLLFVFLMFRLLFIFFFFFFNDTATTEIYTLSLHDALPISPWPSSVTQARCGSASSSWRSATRSPRRRSEEHTSELQSHLNLVCRLLLEKKKRKGISRPVTKRQSSSATAHDGDCQQ